jgi:hypothetical protein
MPSVGHIMQLLSECGVTRADLIEALKDDVVKAAIVAKTREVQSYWRSIAPVAEHDRVRDVYGEEAGPSGAYRRRRSLVGLGRLVVFDDGRATVAFPVLGVIDWHAGGRTRTTGRARLLRALSFRRSVPLRTHCGRKAKKQLLDQVLNGLTANWITRYGARARGSMLFHWLTNIRSSSRVEPGEM